MMTVFDGQTMRDDIVARMLGSDADLETSRYLDRLVELATLEEAEHQFLIDPFDRSVALVLQLFQSSDLDPWDVDLSSFLEMFNERIKESENIDLPTCGRLVRMAWCILRGQASTLLERQEHAFDFEEEEVWDFDGGWESEFDDADYNFSLGVLTGAADEALPQMFEGRIHRDESRPVTLGELLMGLQDAGRLAAEQRLREEIAKERREANARARERFSGSLHIEDLEGDLQRTWESLKIRSRGAGKPIGLGDLVDDISSKSVESGIPKEEAEIEAQVTALVSALFLTNRGYVDLKQENGRNGKITLKDLWTEDEDFSTLSQKLHPKPMIAEVIADV
jgi:chromatin segregation and condensation protein Rec8/ScpA/Scc1 (kleisin family)|uniref:Segregation and condensation protein A n=1 Tax=uncultured marine group II/III euryarchaeote SAT1000_40_C12 TaxID=1456580 RepID=A0A075I7Y0_9EURY|nr:segregation and condensation protein A [uncultured marine group II/III euryarchaeote SAT1000_40_C12]